jgi:hypothetical protein
MRKTTMESYHAEAVKLFGEDKLNWRFVCPVCGNSASTQDYKDAGAKMSAVGYSCLGRWEEKGCDYSGGGLFNLNPVEIDGGFYFELDGHE